MISVEEELLLKRFYRISHRSKEEVVQEAARKKHRDQGKGHFQRRKL